MEYDKWELHQDGNRATPVAIVPVRDMSPAQLRTAIIELTVGMRWGPVYHAVNKNVEPNQNLIELFERVNRLREQRRLGWLEAMQDECRRRGISWVTI